MKICPNCRQTYTDEELNFCLSDGTFLSTVEDEFPRTVAYKPRITNEIKAQPDFPHYPPPTVWQSTQNVQPQSFSMPPGSLKRDQTLPVISLILGILAVFLGCFFLGIPLGLGAIITGGIGLNNEKKAPDKYGGRGLAMGGVITGAIGLAIGIMFFVLIIWG